MNYNQLQKCKIEIRSQLKVCKDERSKRILTHDLHIVEEKQMKLLQERARVDERTGSLI
jgi:hypothetical protein